MTSPPPDDIVANSLIYLVGNFRVKLFYPMPTQLNSGHSRGSRTRLDFEVVMREVFTLFCCRVQCLFSFYWHFNELAEKEREETYRSLKCFKD